MSKSTRDYLRDLLDTIHLIKHFTEEGRDVFMQDLKTQFAVIRAYEIIGEIAKRLPDDLLSQHAHIPWLDIKGFRDFLAHNYDRVRLDIVWGAVEQLPDLCAAVEAMLNSLDADEDDI